ncbi:GNAT family N-acetyltransferase [Ruicaihuangia caeni]|uniref:GNAT family N-acetyltransferase n=1 Tax=Ruicaihuangia caeni TaxID=3042517 RepID=A0AAW6T7T0_9MICO|nr:GNAT family N-acetyltransferase [Klugiella sp. YN-L-19]MDI2097848.1 GNAT family N-acetyltransferase [Klugiella sp. YN-L-19]
MPALAEVLASAFTGYAWTDWTVPGRHREERLRELQALYLTEALTHGEVWTTSDRDAVAALVPGEMPPPAPSVVDRIRRLHGAGTPLALRHEARARSLRPAHDRVLATIAVHPRVQRSGKGSAVLQAGLDELDKARQSCLLETSAESNLEFYRAFGFRTVAELEYESSAPRVWIMLRRSGGATRAG